MKVAILSGSVYGTAEEVARHAQKLLSAAGFEASHLPRASLDELKAFAPEAFLVVTSTTGMGELPDNLQPLYYAIRDQLPAWHGLPGGVIGLGDSSYGDTFCGGGEQVRELFGELGVREVLPMLRLDASETVTPRPTPSLGWPSSPPPSRADPGRTPPRRRITAWRLFALHGEGASGRANNAPGVIRRNACPGGG